MRRFANWGRQLSLFGLLAIVFWLAVQQLYAEALSGHSVHLEGQNHQVLEALLRLESDLLPHSAVRADISQRARFEKSDDVVNAASKIAQTQIHYSPSDSLAWYHWLDLSIANGNDYQTGERVGAIKALEVLARNEPDYRLYLARMGLKRWYQISTDERIAFLEHITWVATIAPDVLWGHASLLGKTQLLCRLNGQQQLGVSLCVPGQ